MDTLVFDKGHSTYLVNTARVVTKEQGISADMASALTDSAWSIDDSSPFVKWIAGDFVEADNANQNTQFWTAADLEMGEYSIRYAPLNMIHRYRDPVGFFASTKQVKLEREVAAAGDSQGTMKIQALSGMWTHLFPMEASAVDAANDASLLFYSMECRGTHLRCETDESKGLAGCGEEFDYMSVATHCEHLKDRSSVRHIVNPTFRGGALIVPPVRPGWSNASAGVISDAVMQEAAAYAEAHEAAYASLEKDGADLSASQWEMLMAQVYLYAMAGQEK